MTNRQFEDFTQINGETISYHVVTDETAGTVIVSGGTSQNVVKGNVLVATERPDVYVVVGSVEDLGEPAAPQVSDVEPAGIGFVEDDETDDETETEPENG